MLFALGQPFDPAVHEAVGGSGSHVTEEYQRGYRFHGRTLRPAIVVVGDAPSALKVCWRTGVAGTRSFTRIGKAASSRTRRSARSMMPRSLAPSAIEGASGPHQ